MTLDHERVSVAVKGNWLGQTSALFDGVALFIAIQAIMHASARAVRCTAPPSFTGIVNLLLDLTIPAD